jgi:membrane-anchored mycosin MYCP
MGLSSVNGAPINALPGREPGKAVQYPQLSSHQIIRRITETAHNPPRGVDNKIGYGVIDPVAALTFDVPPGDRLAPEHLTKLLNVPEPPPPPDLRPRHTALIGAAVVAALAVVVAAGAAVRRRRS